MVAPLLMIFFLGWNVEREALLLVLETDSTALNLGVKEAFFSLNLY